MVYYFTSKVVSPSAYIYMGKDKVESRSSIIALEMKLTPVEMRI